MAGSILAFAGGVGGAKLARGLADMLEPGRLTVAVNTGDDFEHMGLPISPDLDTVMYTLAGRANPETGWGVANETWSFMETVGALGGETWFRLGDRDLATHVMRRRDARRRQDALRSDGCVRRGARHPPADRADERPAGPNRRGNG